MCEKERERGEETAMPTQITQPLLLLPPPPPPITSQNPSAVTEHSNVFSWHWLGSLVVVSWTRLSLFPSFCAFLIL